MVSDAEFNHFTRYIPFMKFLKNYTLFSLMVLAMGLFAPACKDKDPGSPADSSKLVKSYSYQIMYDWNEKFLEIERYAAGYRPGPAPRALAYMSLAAYEGCIAGMPEYNSMQNQYAGLSVPQVEDGKEYYWPEVINASYAYLSERFFIASADDLKEKIGLLRQQNEARFLAATNQEVFDRSRLHGEAVAAAMWQWAITDNVGHDAYLNPFGTYDWQAHYQKPGDWVPTVPGPGKPMFGYWGNARVFAISAADRLCAAPLPYSEATNSPFFAQAVEVYNRSGAGISYEDRWIGQYWSDDLVDVTFSPGPRWQAITDQVFVNKNVDLETAIFASVKVGMAINDAAVACWYSKYYYNLERPESYLQRVVDPSYEPPLDNPNNGQKGITPSFPAYPSGHSTMGAAAAEVLTDVFGIDNAMSDLCHKDRTDFIGTPRFFNSFYDMAEENAISRIALGVHWRMDSEVGVDLGYRCGRKVNDLPWKK